MVEFDVVAHDGVLEIRVAAAGTRIVRTPEGPVAQPTDDVPALVAALASWHEALPPPHRVDAGIACELPAVWFPPDRVLHLDEVLVTRDTRAVQTYERLGVAYELID
jgi:hypothetical protein